MTLRCGGLASFVAALSITFPAFSFASVRPKLVAMALKSFTGTASPVGTGSKYLLLVADPSGTENSETDENNNTASSPAEVIGSGSLPNLAADGTGWDPDLGVPLAIRREGSLTVTCAYEEKPFPFKAWPKVD